MHECEQHRDRVERLLAGEVEEGEVDELDSCPSCRDLLALHRRLARLALAAGPPRAAVAGASEEELGRMRRAVLAALAADAGEEAPEPAARAGWARPWLTLARTAAAVRLAAGLAGAVLLAGGGYLAGRGAGPAGADSAGELVAQELARRVAALAPAGLGESPFRYSNLQIRDAGAGQVALAFDVASRLELVRPKDDPLVTEVLVGSLEDASSVGSRLQAIALAAGSMDPGVRQALIKAMLHDPKVAVRLKALERLAGEPGMEEAFLTVLTADASVQMRLLSIDYLTEHRIDPAQLERALAAAAGAEPDTAVRLKARTYLASFTG